MFESGLRRTIDNRDIVTRSLIRAVYRFRDATLVAEKEDDFGSALQNLYRELERAEDLNCRGSFRSFRFEQSAILRSCAEHDFVQARGH
jgi:hypothetical protein